MMKFRIIVFLIIASVHIFSEVAFAWWPYAHCTAVIKQGLGLKEYVNLPDIWDSRTDLQFFNGTFTTTFGAQVVPQFGWSHASYRNGQVWFGKTNVSLSLFTLHIAALEWPRTPTRWGVPAGIEKPSDDMYVIWKNKLKQENKDPEMLLTVQGWAAHNASDSAAHFIYFEGGTPLKWLVDHRLKEEWCSYILIMWDALPDDYFDGNYLFPVYSKGHAGIINLGMKVFRKNRQTVDSTMITRSNRSGCDVISATTINALINDQNDKLEALSDHTWSKSWYLILNIVAVSQGWNVVEVLNRHELAKIKARKAVNKLK